MTRAQFLNDLYRRLSGSGMKKEQAEQHLTYYAEMLADRMEEGMSEDDAVASMEDVETIARRILEEERLPYRPLEKTVKPPEYPDVPKPDGDGGKRVYQVPKKWNRRRVIQAALWTLAILVALGAVSRWILRRLFFRAPDTPTGITEVSYGPQATDIPADVGAEAAPQAPYAEEYAYLDAPYMEGYEYSDGEYSFDYEEVSSIDIEWASGMVYVQSWSGDSVQIQEYAQTELSDRTRMSCIVDDQTLEIRYRNGSSWGNVRGSKWLTVLVPDGMLTELDIETISADVQLYGLEIKELDVSTTSGDLNTEECYAQTAELSTTSGDISGTVVSNDLEVYSISGDIYLYSKETLERAKLATTSGTVFLSLEDAAAQSIGVSSVSGDISLSLPYDLGFTLDYSTVSGDLTAIPDATLQDRKYVHNGGGCEIEVETVSGNLEIF